LVFKASRSKLLDQITSKIYVGNESSELLVTCH
jgi:hypothetical protein